MPEFQLFANIAKSVDSDPITSWESLHIVAGQITDLLTARDPKLNLTGHDRENLVTVTNKIGLGTLALLDDNPVAPFNSDATRIERMKDAATLGSVIRAFTDAAEDMLTPSGKPSLQPGRVDLLKQTIAGIYAARPAVRELNARRDTLVATALDQLEGVGELVVPHATREALKPVLLSAHP